MGVNEEGIIQAIYQKLMFSPNERQKSKAEVLESQAVDNDRPTKISGTLEKIIEKMSPRSRKGGEKGILELKENILNAKEVGTIAAIEPEKSETRENPEKIEAQEAQSENERNEEVAEILTNLVAKVVEESVENPLAEPLAEPEPVVEAIVAKPSDEVNQTEPESTVASGSA